jgi:type II secretory pathway pseudopilin PulG
MSLITLSDIRDQRGFTLAELLIASGVTMLVLGGAVALTSQVQAGYTRQMEDAAAEQEGRYALEWISRLVRSAGNAPFPIATSACPEAGTEYKAFVWDPDDDGLNDDLRIQSDSNPPDGILGGLDGACNQANEDVTVSYDPDTSSITFVDNNLGGGATIRTDAVIAGLNFIFRKNEDNDPPGGDGVRDLADDENEVIYVETQVTVRTRSIDPNTGLPRTRVLSQEVRVRGRNY